MDLSRLSIAHLGVVGHVRLPIFLVLWQPVSIRNARQRILSCLQNKIRNITQNANPFLSSQVSFKSSFHELSKLECLCIALGCFGCQKEKWSCQLIMALTFWQSKRFMFQSHNRLRFLFLAFVPGPGFLAASRILKSMSLKKIGTKKCQLPFLHFCFFFKCCVCVRTPAYTHTHTHTHTSMQQMHTHKHQHTTHTQTHQHSTHRHTSTQHRRTHTPT